MKVEEEISKLKQTQHEIVISVNILTDILWKMGTYLYKHFDDPNIRSHLRDLGRELKQIRSPRNR